MRQKNRQKDNNGKKVNTGRTIGSVLLAAAMTATACDAPHHSVATDIRGAWEHSAEVVMNNADTATERDILLFLRYDGRCREDSLTLDITTYTPDSLKTREQVTLRMMAHAHKSPVSEEYAQLYRRKAVLRDTGNYRFVLRPTRTVKGVTAVGLHIVKHE